MQQFTKIAVKNYQYNLVYIDSNPTLTYSAQSKIYTAG